MSPRSRRTWHDDLRYTFRFTFPGTCYTQPRFAQSLQAYPTRPRTVGSTRARRPAILDPAEQGTGMDRLSHFRPISAHAKHSTTFRHEGQNGTPDTMASADPEELPGPQDLREAEAGHRHPEPDRHPEAKLRQVPADRHRRSRSARTSASRACSRASSRSRTSPRRARSSSCRTTSRSRSTTSTSAARAA